MLRYYSSSCVRRLVSVPCAQARLIKGFVFALLALALLLFAACGGGDEGPGGASTTDEEREAILPTIAEPPPGAVSAAEAIDQIGSSATVCGEVKKASFLSRSSGTPTVLELDSTFPDDIFAAIIFSRNRINFPVPPETLYANRRLCVTGLVEVAKRHLPTTLGIPMMDVTSPDQIQILR